MAVQVSMPALGESVSEGVVTRWLKREGDGVEEGESLLEVSTDKVDTEIPSPVSGILVSVLVQEDDTVAVGGDLALVDDAAQPSAPSTPPTADAPPARRAPRAAATRTVPTGDVFATPAVVALAREHGVALASVAGSGPGERIRPQDVRAAAGLPAWRPAAGPAPGSKPPPFTRPVGAPTPIATPDQALDAPVEPAQAADSADLTTASPAILMREVDVTAIDTVRAAEGVAFASREGASLTVWAFVAKATAEALRSVPALNGHSDSVHLAVIADDGCTVIEEADGLSLAGTARRGATGGDTARATFSVVLAEGAMVDVPRIAAGRAAALGVGGPVKEPGVVATADGADALAVRSVCRLALAYDERGVTRDEARRFLTTVGDRLERGRFDVRSGP